MALPPLGNRSILFLLLHSEISQNNFLVIIKTFWLVTLGHLQRLYRKYGEENDPEPNR